MNINFKQPRYILPLIALPFLWIFFYIYKQTAGPGPAVTGGRDSLQLDVAGVSDQVKNRPIDGKLDAYLERYKQSDGYTAIGELLEEQPKDQRISSSYNDKERKMLDSIERLSKARFSGSSMPPRPGQNFPGVNAPPKYSSLQQDQAMAAALSTLGRPAAREPDAYSAPRTPAGPDPMQLFRQQMALVDSMGKANDPDYKAVQQHNQRLAQMEQQKATEKKLPVSKSGADPAIFNTVSSARDDAFITAVIDQDITGYSGSRLRIRLLEDMMAGRFLVRQGSYLYAEISGFSGQRVNLSVTSIMQGGRILPVKLQVYDNDGLSGLYVPASAFREFSKELGVNTSQGITLQQQAENNSQLVMSLLQKMFQSTTTAVGKLIRQNKAKIKYNTLVYLIDPEELRITQNRY